MSSVKVGFAGVQGVPAAAIQTFYRDNWKRRIALSDDAFYRWQFIDNPVHAGTDQCIVATLDGEIAGVMGSASRTFFLEGRPLRGAELTTWVVSERHRGKGIGPAILQFLQEQYELLLGTGITPDALTVYLRSGFHYVRHLPRYLRVHDLQGVEPYCRVEPLARKLVRHRLQAGAPDGERCAEVPANEELLVETSRRFIADRSAFDRGPSAVQWRYHDHPYFRYELSGLRSLSGECIWVATRVDILPNGARVLRVLDMVGPQSLYATAASHLDELARRAGAAATDFFCTTASLGAALRASGWFSVLDEPFLLLPHLFAPVELREPPTTSLILWARENAQQLLDMSKLYVSKSDADLDRPTLDTLKPYEC